jgi:adenylate cyclase
MVIEKGFHSRFVGRDKVMKELVDRLDESITGRGQLVLISGEAGIGKTRLTHELKKYAISKNVRCLEGNCIYHEVSDPYLPFIKALSDITAPSLVDESQKYVTIEEAFLINNAGVVVSHAARIGANILDEDIVGGMLSAVEAFVKDAFGDEESLTNGLDTLGYGATRILIEHGKLVFLAVVLSGVEPEGLREDLRNLVRKIEDEHLDILRDWDGKEVKIRDIAQIIRGLTDVKYKIKRAIKDIDIKKEKDRIFERVLQLIIETSKDEPILLVLEDIHWADTSSLQLLQYVARNTKDSRVFIVGTYRPEELYDVGDKKIHPLKETIQRMSRYKIFTHMELNRLIHSEVSEMLTSIFDTPNLPGGFVDRLYKETEGNPFFIEEMLYSFHDEGIIRLDGGAWCFGEVSESVIPTTIKDIVTLRIERLDEGSIDAIKYASVIGREFDFNVLGRTMSINEEELITTLEKLETKKLIQADTKNDELYRFNHSKIREVVYEGLSSHRKRMMHEGVGMVMEELNKDKLENVVYKLAHHYSNTKDHDKALDYSIQAGEKAGGEFALDEAFSYYGQAMNAIERMEENAENKRKKLDIITHLGDICYVTGKWDQAYGYYSRARKLSEELSNDKSRAASYRSLGLIHLCKSEWEKALVKLEIAFEISENIDDYHGIADAAYQLGTFYEKKGEYQKSIKSYGKCMENAVNIGDSQEIARGYLGVGRVYAQKGQYRDSIDSFKKAVEILEKIGDLDELSKAYVNFGATNILLNVDEAIKYLNKAIDLANKTGNIRMKGYALTNLAYIFIKKNDLETASSYLDKALEIFERFEERMLISAVYLNYGTIHRLQKEWKKATDYFERAIKIFKELGTPYYLGEVFFEYGLMFKDKGNANKAEERLTKAIDIFKDLQNNEMIEKVEKELSTL